MNRRKFILGAGLVGTLGLLGGGTSPSESSLSIGVWLSERAATYDDLATRISEYLGRALEPIRDDIDLEVSEQSIRLDVEDGTRLMTVEWPRLVLAGAAGGGTVVPVRDVNLLVTDGDPTSSPAGYGMRGVAAVTGARFVASMPPVERSPLVVDYTRPAAVTQLLLHECGHALGLNHRHGSVTTDGDAVVATPMIGGYAWADDDVRRRELGSSADTCGTRYPTRLPDRRRLRLGYGPCATRAIQRRWGTRHRRSHTGAD